MQTPVQVTFRDMPVSDPVEAQCWQEVEKLDRYFDRIISCHVTITESHHRHRLSNHFAIRITVSAPGRELVVNREPAQRRDNEEIESAIRDAFDRMRRQLQDHANQLRGDAKWRDGSGPSCAAG